MLKLCDWLVMVVYAFLTYLSMLIVNIVEEMYWHSTNIIVSFNKYLLIIYLSKYIVEIYYVKYKVGHICSR